MIDPIAETRAWVRRAVVGLGLCPFAAAPEAAGRIRYATTDASDPDALVDALADELGRLVSPSGATIETTLLVCPRAFPDFLDFNDFVGVADDCVAACGLDGVVQVVAFHPRFRFAGADEDDVGNATNRSPHSTLQLLREASVARAVASVDTDRLIAANAETLARLGAAGWDAVRAGWQHDAAHDAAPGVAAAARPLR